MLPPGQRAVLRRRRMEPESITLPPRGCGRRGLRERGLRLSGALSRARRTAPTRRGLEDDVMTGA